MTLRFASPPSTRARGAPPQRKRTSITAALALIACAAFAQRAAAAEPVASPRTCAATYAEGEAVEVAWKVTPGSVAGAALERRGPGLDWWIGPLQLQTYELSSTDGRFEDFSELQHQAARNRCGEWVGWGQSSFLKDPETFEWERSLGPFITVSSRLNYPSHGTPLALLDAPQIPGFEYLAAYPVHFRDYAAVGLWRSKKGNPESLIVAIRQNDAKRENKGKSSNPTHDYDVVARIPLNLYVFSVTRPFAPGISVQAMSQSEPGKPYYFVDMSWEDYPEREEVNPAVLDIERYKPFIPGAPAPEGPPPNR